MGQTGGREDGNFLASGDGVHDVDGGQSGLDHFLGIDTRPGIDGLTLNVEKVLGEDGRSLVDGFAGAVEDTAEHVLRDGSSEDIAGEFAKSVFRVDAGSSFKDLDNGLGSWDLEDLAGAQGSIGKFQLYDFGEFRKFNFVENDERSVDSGDGLVRWVEKKKKKQIFSSVERHETRDVSHGLRPSSQFSQNHREIKIARFFAILRNDYLVE